MKKQRETIEDQGIKEIEALKALKSKEDLEALEPEENQGVESILFFSKIMRTDENKTKKAEIRKREEKVKRKNLKYKTNNYLYHF